MNLMNSSLFNKKIVFVIILICSVYSFYAQTYSDDKVSIYLSHKQILKEKDSLFLNFEIEKRSITGFAKFELTGNNSIKFHNLEIANTAISISGNTLKIIWVDLPQNATFSLIIPISTNGNGNNYVLNGSFSYVFNKEIYKLPISSIDLSVPSVQKEAGNIAISKDDNATISETVATENTKTNYYISDLSGKTGKYPKNSKNIKSISGSYDKVYNEDVVFQVQIAALKKRISKKKLSEIYTGNLPVKEEIDANGWYKYSIGNFTTYEEAHKLKISCNVADAFVTARSGGKNIHILDALKTSINKSEPKDFYSYSIQIGAYSKAYSYQKIAKLLNIQHLVSIEHSDNLYKYTIGNFQNYSDAEQIKKSLNIPDAFIVAYKNGIRTDIQSLKR